jgi:hypothetical protein
MERQESLRRYQEILDRSEQKGSKSAFMRVGLAQRTVLERMKIKALRQILRLIGIESTAAYMGVKRIPIACRPARTRQREAAEAPMTYPAGFAGG